MNTLLLDGYDIWKKDGLIISLSVSLLFFPTVCLLDDEVVGLPSTALCMWGSTIANVAAFALIFPAVSLKTKIFHNFSISQQQKKSTS